MPLPPRLHLQVSLSLIAMHQGAQKIIKNQKNENPSGISIAVIIALPVRFYSNPWNLFSVAKGIASGPMVLNFVEEYN